MAKQNGIMSNILEEGKGLTNSLDTVKEEESFDLTEEITQQVFKVI